MASWKKLQQCGSNWVVKTAPVVLKQRKTKTINLQPTFKSHFTSKPHLKQDCIVKITGRLYGFYLPIFTTTKKQRWKYCFSQFFWSLLGIFADCLTPIELSTCECLQMFNELYKLYYYAYADIPRWKYRYRFRQDISTSNYVYVSGHKLTALHPAAQLQEKWQLCPQTSQNTVYWNETINTKLFM